jgi:hypothetical protein
VSNRRSPPALRKRALELYEHCYEDFGPTLAAEKLAEEHGVVLSRETLRRWLLVAHLWPGRTKERLHRRRRPRRERFGELVQFDGSHHAWFEQRAAPCCLMVMIDDATGRSVAHMAEGETTEAAFAVLRKWIERHGVPGALYADRKNIYVSEREPTEHERHAGSGPVTDFGRACRRLDVEMITARSPQAKGRVERRNGVLQDRLVKELRLRGICDIVSANAMLDEFLERLDERLAQGAAQPANAHRALPPDEPLEEILCWEQTRKVARDWSVAWEGGKLQIEAQPGGPVPGASVTVRRRIGGTLGIIYHGRPLRFQEIGAAPVANQTVSRPPRGAEGGGLPSQTRPPSPKETARRRGAGGKAPSPPSPP